MSNLFARPKNQGAGTEHLSTTKASLLVAVRSVVVGLAVTVGCLLSALPASAMPMSCGQATAVAAIYKAQGDVQYIFGNYQGASYYYGLARGILEAGCGG